MHLVDDIRSPTFAGKKISLVMNTYYMKGKQSCTYGGVQESRSTTKSIIFFVKQRFRNSIRDVNTLTGDDVDFDHDILLAEVQTRLKPISWEEETKIEFRKNQEQRK